MNPCLIVLLRLTQLIFSAIIISLSVVLILGQRAGDSPVITKFSIFLGSFGLFMSIFGVFSQIFAVLRQSKIVGSLDFVVALVQFAGGVATAVALGPGINSCSNKRWRETNSIINGGYIVVNGQNFVYKHTPFESRCQMAFAITTFEFLIGMTFVMSGVAMVLAAQKRKTPQVPKW
ncbi:hypothetical protein AOL_s00007g26 [Orbilia oligospora ATCC 24927]|uniref:MARVEL domain-containing protein n=1 Tax=Arthrobotrys oligospora (strain ATCC 24927 / CBS 115.81 / DSM 1491) TaxID=756982 RepID=G1X167_ARTOA|nr:hypothetical protein AOL_s00007g26 [Orbilia oligospora ATCC 24927]EGX53077.1 hypothetical protein AOL_s00007g26 [Orbilia oligospora ATCC 24927]